MRLSKAPWYFILRYTLKILKYLFKLFSPNVPKKTTEIQPDCITGDALRFIFSLIYQTRIILLLGNLQDQ